MAAASKTEGSVGCSAAACGPVVAMPGTEGCSCGSDAAESVAAAAKTEASVGCSAAAGPVMAMPGTEGCTCGSDAAESVVRMAGVTWRPFTAMALSSTAVARDGRWYCRKQSLLCPVTCDVPGCAVSTRRENE